MKKIHLLIIALLMLAFGACAPKEKTVDFPTVEASTTTSIIIEKVELTDSLTTLHMRGYNRPGYWIRVVPETHLAADGKTEQRRQLTQVVDVTHSLANRRGVIQVPPTTSVAFTAQHRSREESIFAA